MVGQKASTRPAWAAAPSGRATPGGSACLLWINPLEPRVHELPPVDAKREVAFCLNHVGERPANSCDVFLTRHQQDRNSTTPKLRRWSCIARSCRHRADRSRRNAFLRRARRCSATGSSTSRSSCSSAASSPSARSEFGNDPALCRCSGTWADRLYPARGPFPLTRRCALALGLGLASS